MKKKFKLFATIASISMTLALMVFGVLAATSVNVTISSNVSYTASGVAFKLYGKSELASSQPVGDATDLTEGEGTANSADTVITVGVTNAGTDQMTLPAQTFTASNTWVVYTFTVENIGSNVIDAITVSATAGDTNVIASADTPTGNLAQGAKETFRCYFHLENSNRSIDQEGTSVEIVVGEAQTLALPTIQETSSANTGSGPIYTVTNIPAGSTTLEILWDENGYTPQGNATPWEPSVWQEYSYEITGDTVIIDTNDFVDISSGDIGGPVSPDLVSQLSSQQLALGFSWGFVMKYRITDGTSYSDWSRVIHAYYDT